jgi:hypothetical protein
MPARLILDFLEDDPRDAVLLGFREPRRFA